MILNDLYHGTIDALIISVDRLNNNKKQDID